MRCLPIGGGHLIDVLQTSNGAGWWAACWAIYLTAYWAAYWATY
jgi:hypothetical protein